jgi:hypothetical protein
VLRIFLTKQLTDRRVIEVSKKRIGRRDELGKKRKRKKGKKKF